MATLERDEVLEIAELAQLELTDRELEPMQREMAAILDYFKVLAATDTTGVAPMVHGRLARGSSMDALATVRADRSEPSLPVDDALAAAPARFHDLISVPAIIKGS